MLGYFFPEKKERPLIGLTGLGGGGLFFGGISLSPFEAQYIVVAGGGGAGGYWPGGASAGGGGAGGYRTSVIGATSGCNQPAEPVIEVLVETNYTVCVGNGGAGAPGGNAGGPVSYNGCDSRFGPIISVGGGYGSWTIASPGGSGGGGGGWGDPANTPTGTNGQGYPGAPANYTRTGNGGGGAGGAGSGQNGGLGIYNPLTGVTYAHGGRGPGAPAEYTAPEAINSGDGGNAAYSGPPGSPGVVVVLHPSSHTVYNPGGGLSYATYPGPGSNMVTCFTSGFGNICWA